MSSSAEPPEPPTTREPRAAAFDAAAVPPPAPLGADVHTDWFGTPVRADGKRPVEPVPCPFCAEGFTRAADLESHVAATHGVSTRPLVTGRLEARLRRWSHGLGWLPVWFVAPACLVLLALAWGAWGDDVFAGGPQDPWYLVKLVTIVFLAPLLPVLYVSARIFDRHA